VRAWDPDPERVAAFAAGRPPVVEPGLADLLAAGCRQHRLSFTDEPAEALFGADIAWVTFDTPLDEHDEADAESVYAQAEDLLGYLQPGALVLISSQVPVGFTSRLERSPAGRAIRFACAPENLRLGSAIAQAHSPEPLVVGVRCEEDRRRLERLFAPFERPCLWLSVESAEMAKQARNAHLAATAALANEVARLCETVGADARDVERALRADSRIGPLAYVAPGGPLAGGTLTRDLRYLAACGRQHGVETPLVAGILASDEGHGFAKKKNQDFQLYATVAFVRAHLLD